VHYNGGNELSSVVTICIRRNNIVAIYPNPATNYINVEIQNYSAKNIYVSIFDVTGRRVKEVSLANAPTQHISVKELKTGFYHMIIYEDYKISYETGLLVK
jgi:hypothetical protein